MGELTQSPKSLSVNIYPLHPYAATPKNYTPNITPENTFIVKYYFIENASKATDHLSIIIDSLITEKIYRDTDFQNFAEYYVDFYRKTEEINEQFRENINGFFDNSLEGHLNDLLFRYRWENKKFMECSYYKNGKVVKTVYEKNGALFKHTRFLRQNKGNQMEVKEIKE